MANDANAIAMLDSAFWKCYEKHIYSNLACYDETTKVLYTAVHKFEMPEISEFL